MSLFEAIDASALIRATRERREALERFDAQARELATLVDECGRLPVDKREVPAISAATIAFHGPTGGPDLGGELAVARDAYQPAFDAAVARATEKGAAEADLAEELSRQQSRFRFVSIVLVGLILLLVVIAQ